MCWCLSGIIWGTIVTLKVEIYIAKYVATNKMLIILMNAILC